MSKQTTTLSHTFQYVWLENTEKKLMDAFEDIHNVCFAIIEECLRNSTLEHRKLCCSCKENDDPNGLDFAKERKRYKMRFSSSVETWKDKFLKLRKKYIYLKSSCKRKGNLSAESKVDLSEEAKESEKVNSIDTEEELATEEKEDPKCFGPDNSDKSVENTPRAELPDVIVVNSDDEDGDQGTQSNTPKSLQIENENIQDSILLEMKGIHESLDCSIYEKEEEFGSSASEKRLRNEHESDPSWKRANHIPLHRRWNSKIRYLDSSNTLSSNKSIHQFFAPHSVTQARNIALKRSKRQRVDSSTEFSVMNRTKEGSKWASDTDGSLKFIESMIETASSILDSNHDKREGEFNSESKDCKTQRYKNDLKGTAKQGHLDDTEKLALIIDSQNAAPAISNTSPPPPPQDSRKGLYSKEEEARKKDHDVRCWSFCDVSCLPTSASTPVVPTKTGKKYHQNTKDFEDTMWSAPDSPAVVRSIFSTPDKTSDNDKIPEICQLECQKENQQKNDQSKLLGRETKLEILRDKLPLVTNTAKDSILMGHHKNVSEKTSDGDLSADMFYEPTENTESIQENILSKETAKGEQNEAITVADKEKDAEAKFKDSTCFERPKASMNYKFNAVVRKRDERDKLDGYACAECAAWYDDEKDWEKRRNHLRNVCRHKAVSSPPPSTPDGFWSLGFPDTPVYMKKGLMLAEDDTLPLHARPKKRKDRADKSKETEMNVDE